MPLDVSVDRSSPVPLWHQLAVGIETAISSGALTPGDRLENEVALTARLGLARPTVRQAIQELARKGLVVRKQGVGTQVVHSRRARDSRLMSLNDDLTRSGQHPSTRLLHWSVGPMPAQARVHLAGVDTGGEFVHVRRLRSADDAPLAILDNYLPAALAPTEEDVAARGLYGALRAIGHTPKIAHQTIGARLLDAEEAGLFTEEVGSAALTVERTVFDDTGVFLELGKHVYRASHYAVEMSVLS